MAVVEDLRIDQSKVTGDNGAVYVLQWLSSAEQALLELAPDVIKPEHALVEATLLRLATGVDPYPLPGRSSRSLTARCLVALYTRGEMRTLFETVLALLKVAGETKVGERDARVSAFYCIGEIMETMGAQIMSFMTEIAMASLKTSKATSNSVLLRFHALVALKKALSTSARALTDSASKDIIKQMRGYLVDKALPIQRVAADVLVAMYPSGDGNRSVSDVDAIVAICTKSLDGADQQTRRSLARLVGHMLASTQVERAAPAEPAKKGRKDQDADADNAPGIPGLSVEGPKLVMTPGDMLLQLSAQFNRPAITRKTRIGLFDFYTTLFTMLGPTFVENNYAVIVKHIFSEIVSTPRSCVSRYDILLVRKLVGILLRDLVGIRMLSEQGQIGAIRELAFSYLRKWPALMAGQTAPSPLVLVIALREVAGLLQQLGNAPHPVQDALADPLVELLSHPNHSTRVAAAWALKCFCYSAPRRLAKLILTLMEALQNNIAALSSGAAQHDIESPTLGHAYGLAALFSLVPVKPLYVSYDLSAKVLDLAIQLLKRSGEHEIKVATVEVEVAWTCIASLMSLGPNFVRAHLPQILVLWRNALPKPTTKDTARNSGRSDTEWKFLLHVRECALGAILCFLQHNSSLTTLDVARRISSFLNHALLFANAYIVQVSDETREQGISPAATQVPPATREAMLRRRVYQCHSALGFSSLGVSSTETLMQSVVSIFASPDYFASSSLQASITSASGNFSSVWLMADGYGFGVCSTASCVDSHLGDSHAPGQESRDHLNRDTIEAAIDKLITTPVIGSLEHDTCELWRTHRTGDTFAECPPPATAVVDAAMELFSLIMPLQDVPTCMKAISHMVDSVRSPKLDRNVGRKAAVFVNATIALMLALRIATGPNSRQARDTFGAVQVSSTIAEFLKGAILDGDVILRGAGSEAIGRLAGLAGTAFLTSQITSLVDQVVNNRDPNGRAGSALAFGAIYNHVGGLAAGPLLKTTVNVLMSLGNDPHPVVHFWALSALAQVINAASLSYGPFVTSTIGMLLNLYSLDSHEPEGGSLNNSNLAGDLPTYQVVCQIIDALIGVIGPELQESSSRRSIILDLVTEFLHEPDDGIGVEAIKCVQHFLIFAPGKMSIPDLTKRLRQNLKSSRRPLKVASINAMYQLVQRDALLMSRIGGDSLVEELFGMLDDDSTIDGVRSVILSWLQQTAAQNPSAWIDLCQRIMSRTTASQQATDAAAKAPGLQDDEGESLSLGTAIKTGERQTSRWRTQLFALQCLHDICRLTVALGVREHLDVPYAKRRGVPLTNLLVSRVPDLIKMAFTASAAHVAEIRLEGLVVLKDVIQIFAKSPDPDYDDALLLEQHQAPITAALTPAFSQDSTPEILSSAVQVCAVYVGSGVVKDISRMGRILKLLTSALEQSKGSGTLSIGDIGHLSPNASVMLRISTLTAWAELQIASAVQKYLDNIIQPYRSTLAGLWIVSLRDYASIRVDTEVLQDPASATIDSSYFGLGREVLLPYYSRSWPRILHAVAIAMQARDPFVLAAMDGLDAPQTATSLVEDTSPRNDPTAFFFPLFGLVYEALSSQSSESASIVPSSEVMVTALLALKSLVRPEYCGKAILDVSVFDELISLCYRIALAEPAVVQRHLLEAIESLATSQSGRLTPAATNGHILDRAPADGPLSHCLRICAFVLRHAVPTSRASTSSLPGNSPPEQVAMLNVAFVAFAQVSSQFEASKREDLRAVGISLYLAFLKDEFSEIDLAGPTLPALKSLLEVGPSVSLTEDSSYSQVVHGILSVCLANIDEMRGREGAAAQLKVKNNMLAAVLVLTVVPPALKISQMALEQCYYLISLKLTEATELSLIAAHCAKTLIGGASGGNPVLQHCVKFLVPGMITYVARVASLLEDAAAVDTHTTATEEILRAFAGVLACTPEAKRSPALAVILPTEALLLDPTKIPPSNLHVQAIAQLLTFAASNPSAFKEAAAKLDPPVRERLETSVRQALGSSAAATGSTTKPQISLKSF